MDALTENIDIIPGTHIHDIDKSFTFIYGVLGVLSAVMNLGVILAYGLMKSIYQNNANFLLFCTALADFCITVLLWMRFLILQLKVNCYRIIPTRILTYVYLLLLDYSFCLGLGTLLIYAVDRYLSTVRLSVRTQTLKKKDIKTVLMVIWIASFFPSLIELILSRFNYIYYDNYSVATLRSCLHATLIVFILLIIIIVNKSQKIHSHTLNPLNTWSGYYSRTEIRIATINVREKTRLINILIALVITYTITYLPYMIFITMDQHNVLKHEGVPVSYIITANVCEVLYFLSSFVKPMIILYRSNDFRTSLAEHPIVRWLFKRHKYNIYTWSTPFQSWGSQTKMELPKPQIIVNFYSYKRTF